MLSKQVPTIPTRYMPVSPPATAKLVIASISAPKQFSVLEAQLKLKSGTLDNVAQRFGYDGGV